MLKAIKLTENQESKIIEMLNELFPEHKWSLSNDLAENGLIDCDIHLNRPKFQLIHWFELCITHLPVALYRHAMHKYNKSPIEALEIITKNLIIFEDFGRYEINPIDYLYKEFKKLN